MHPSLSLIKVALVFCTIFVHVCTSRSIVKDEGEELKRQRRSWLPWPFSKESKRDWTDPEIAASAVDIIKHWGYPVEQYNVTTEDGYILLLLRIPYGRQSNSTPTEPRPVIYLQHGLESSCVDWIANLPHQAAAFIYADHGFDVWMGNFRGNTYSMRHAKLSHTQHEFWRFSWDEMAHYDLPALINTALNISGAQSVYYVGHSMGTSTIFAKLSQDPSFAKIIKKVYALAPVGTVSHIKGPAKYLSPFTWLLEHILSDVGIDDIFPTTKLQDELARYFCGSVITEIFCNNLLMLLTGPESKQLNATRMPVYLSHTPAGTSTRTVAHYAQMHNAKKFQMYDYGTRSSNEQNYHQKSPPVYDVSRIQTPIVLYWGGQDWLADPDDVEALSPQLRNLAGSVYLPHFNHVDFIWGLLAAKEVYTPIYNDVMADFANGM